MPQEEVRIVKAETTVDAERYLKKNLKKIVKTILRQNKTPKISQIITNLN